MNDTYHRHVDIAGIEFHVDLLVNHGLRVGMKIQPDARHNDGFF